jgi:hypothetical protein
MRHDIRYEVRAYHHQCGRHDESARQACLFQLTGNLLDRGAQRLVIDSRQDRDVIDQRTIYRAMGNRPQETGLVHEHMSSTWDGLLWLADIAAWYYGNCGDWRTRIMPVITTVCDVNQP